MKKKNVFSIVTVSYNAEKLVESTVRSIISQTFRDYEFIVIDGGSTDNTLSILEMYKDRIDILISETDKGIYDAMNKAINLASGKYINFMNCGDSFADESVLCNIALNVHNSPDVIYGKTILNTSVGKYMSTPSVKIGDSILKNMPFCHQSSFVRLELAKKHPFDLQYKVSADYNMFLQLFNEGCIFYYVDFPVSIYQYDRPNDHLQYKRALDVVRVNKRLSFYLQVIRFFIMSYVRLFVPNRLYCFIRRWKYCSKFEYLGD